MQSILEKENNGSCGVNSTKSNVFVLCTGRCGSVTFARACSHMSNYTSGHETRCRELGEERLNYPAHHIEADNRLSWFLGGLDTRFGDNAVYVHLKRDAERVAESYNRRWTYEGSILMAFGRGVLKNQYGGMEVARDYVRTVTENITHFLSDKSRVHHVDIDDPMRTFEMFWKDIGAEGDLDQALKEFTEKHNPSVQPQSNAKTSDGNSAASVIQQLETSRDSLRAETLSLKAKNLQLRNANTAFERERDRLKASQGLSDSLAFAFESMTLSGLMQDRVRLAFYNAKAALRNRPKQSLLKFLPEKHKKEIKAVRKRLKKWNRKAKSPLQDLKLDENGRYTLPVDLRPRWDKATRVQPYEAMLWSFYEEHAVAWFEDLARAPQTVGELVQAHWALVRWHWSKRRFEKAGSSFEALRAALPQATWPEGFLALEALTLSHLGRTDEALAGMNGDSAEMRLTRFSILRQDDRDADTCLEPLNAHYRERNLAPVERRDRQRPLSIANLAATAPPDPRSQEAQVSVVMPAFNAEETIGFAIDGILRQSWTNLELIVVDDVSQDATWEIVCEIAKADTRIVPIRQPENRGAYGARNAGLRAAKGRFVTINDADDWSHPERIALQAKAMLESGIANATFGTRVLWDLQFGRAANYRSASMLNMSSLLFERTIALELNGWDLTRFAADSEFKHRYDQHVGVPHQKLAADTPMAWILTSERSLTQSSATGIQSLPYGARCQYREAYREWHRSAGSLRLGETRAFPVPQIALCKNPGPIVCDQLLISDFSDETSSEAGLEAITQALGRRHRIALLHLPRLENFSEPIDRLVRNLICKYAIPVVVPGESVTSTSTTVLDPRGLEYLPASRVPVETESIHISASSFTRLSSNLGEAEAKARIVELVDKEPEIIGNAADAC